MKVDELVDKVPGGQVGILAIALLTLPSVRAAARPLLKTAIVTGYTVVESAKEMVAEAREQAEDMMAEVKAEREQRMQPQGGEQPAQPQPQQQSMGEQPSQQSQQG